MADLLIKGMEKLKAGQILQVAENWNGALYVRETTEGKWCPLVEVPIHGRLIDVDAMERFMSDTVQGDIRAYPYSDTLWDMAFRWIDNQSTIIEASEGGEHK